MSEDRRLEVLRAIVEDYVATREPVGSRVLTERHRLGVSPATIRNDMAALEEAGLIAQPHTSAGRIPTDKGYRLFVDRLAEVRPLSSPQKRAIETFLSQGVDLDDVLGRAGRLIAQLTGQVAVVQYPSLRRSGLRHLELVPVGADRLLVVVITDTGRVEQRFLEVPADADVDDVVLAELRARLNAAAAGKRLVDLPETFAQVAAQVAPALGPLAGLVAATVVDTLGEQNEERIVLAGTANLARATMRFEQGLRPVLEALEEQVVLLGLLTEMALEPGAGPVAVRIGHEVGLEGLAEASVITSGYGSASDDGDAVAILGSIGPTRMDYPGTIAAVRAVARYLSRVLPS
ncbi:heat-inducible transcription repressor HrcA [Xylanimonas cellulosilytica DSM 15894]|uniref:Heat-inducible transcription repressor HrcA n=1 Tax=Xylanimonas cellulosilytica (strain DSM 15894 / JCM 12276 / CECT 5975 / KCTC 9989 / LMG 20990 / NBRC 107835 / XIL07) TaxID=446471 RepID=D1BUX1_XYLCX|nr:heat-inducible transcriptional repressor HrcA [Xylanimonas cellulosilytica]ACZ31210.1 heat-inducible transcription repressor HrcA [Xylanimonas cellulosilytica DSM 15894]